jgi:hypothetical protein
MEGVPEVLCGAGNFQSALGKRITLAWFRTREGKKRVSFFASAGVGDFFFRRNSHNEKDCPPLFLGYRFVSRSV